MRVPDPEDPKYWLHPKIPSVFLAGKYIEDFRKWKAELQRLLQEFPKEIDSQDYEKGCNASFLMYSYAEIQMWLGKLKEILGEEASE